MTRRQLMAMIAGTPFAALFTARDKVEARPSDLYPRGVGFTLAKHKRVTITDGGRQVNIRATRFDHESYCDTIDISGGRLMAGLTQQRILIEGYPVGGFAAGDAFMDMIDADDPATVKGIPGSWRFAEGHDGSLPEGVCTVSVELIRIG